MAKGTTALGRVIQGREDADRAALGSSARTVTANGTAFNSEDALAIIGTLTITAVAGTTPTLDVKLQESLDNGTNWNDVGSFPQKNATGSHPKTFGPLADQSLLRWVWTIGGTGGPSFTFAIDTKSRRSLI